METIDDIVREMRRYADEDAHVIGRDVLRRDIQTFADRTKKAHEADKKKLVEAQQVAEDALCKLADKSEAVVKHDLTTATDINVGSNAAKMREALEHIREYATIALSHTTDGHVIDAVHNMDALAKSALSAPPRNCDVGTAEEQYERLNKHCDKYPPNCGGCHFTNEEGITLNACGLHWAQMPYEEGEAK